MMIADLTSDTQPFVGKHIGSYNRNFASKWSKTFDKMFGGAEATEVLKMDLQKYN